jgi:hypothetical protein
MNVLKLMSIGFIVVVSACSSQQETLRAADGDRFNVVLLGDAGEKNSELRAAGSLLARMQSGEHDGGKTDALIFLGDNFYPTGLNVPASEVDDKVRSILGQFDELFEVLPRDRVHAVAGNHDYYTGHALDASALFGLIDIELGPIGISDRGNERAKAIPQWTYHYEMPAAVRFGIPSSPDSIEFVFFDSARLLRTEPPAWSESLDSLERLLRKTTDNPRIAWRVLAAHHPFFSVGEHGGYSTFNDETQEVEYLTACDKDTNALSWFKNFMDPEDLCADRYRAYKDSLAAIIGRTGAKIHAVIAGHDHSLQLLWYPEYIPECPNCPAIHIVSGAVSDMELVKRPYPPNEYTAFDVNTKEGLSQTGFVQLGFEQDQLRVVFFNGRKGEPIDMGGGKTEFRINRDGNLIEE